ncbi:MAG: AmmeMemoRadiSam system protein A [Bacteroidota bacterium]
MNLTNEEKRVLLKIARSSIQSALGGKPLPQKEYKSESLSRPSGVFVTLRIGENLRGCIGYVEPLFPLAQATQEAAVKAAMEDPRFMPMTLAELAGITIEISVLSPLSELHDKMKIEIGKHGLVIDAGFRRGLLLPQVAIEYGWDREQFLKHTALKAGLPFDAWKRNEVKLFTFTVEKFEESEFEKEEK